MIVQEILVCIFFSMLSYAPLCQNTSCWNHFYSELYQYICKKAKVIYDVECFEVWFAPDRLPPATGNMQMVTAR